MKALIRESYSDIIVQHTVDKELNTRTEYGESGFKFPKVLGDHPVAHLHRFVVDTYDKRLINFKCVDCGGSRTIYSPEYLPEAANSKKQIITDKKAAKSANKIHVPIGYSQARDINDNFKGKPEELRNDLIQPFLPDGSINQNFVSLYGTAAYKYLAPPQ